MAITIESSAISYAPVYNPVGYSVSSTNTAQTNFKYICDVYPTGATSPTYIRLNQPAEPSNGYCYFDVSSIVKGFITRDRDDKTANILHCSNSYNIFQAKFGEQYGPSSGVTNYSDLANTSGVCWNASLNFIDFSSWDVNDYVFGSSSKKFLTNSPRNISVRTSDYWRLYVLCSNGTFYNTVVKTYNNSGALIQTIKWGSSFNSNQKMFSVGVGPANLANLTGVELRFSASSGLPAIDSNVSYYTVYLENSAGSAHTETFTFTIDSLCSKNQIYRLEFLNTLGGYDGFSFTGAPSYNTQIERGFFKKRQGSWSGSVFGYSTENRSKAQLNTKYQDSTKLVSGWITEAESIWLKELFTSPDVGIRDIGNIVNRNGNTNFIPVNIIDSQYQTKKYARETLFNIELTLEFNFNNTRQGW